LAGGTSSLAGESDEKSRPLKEEARSFAALRMTKMAKCDMDIILLGKSSPSPNRALEPTFDIRFEEDTGVRHKQGIILILLTIYTNTIDSLMVMVHNKERKRVCTWKDRCAC
jgi:hypothetical protein